MLLNIISEVGLKLFFRRKVSAHFCWLGIPANSALSFLGVVNLLPVDSTSSLECCRENRTTILSESELEPTKD